MNNNNLRIRLSDDNISVKLKDADNIGINFNDRLVLKYVEPDHSKLDNLDYEHSGHTGFMPSRLSLLPNVQNSIQNSRLVLATFDTETNETNKIGFNELKDRIIKTSPVFEQVNQKGQYIFLEINEEER